MTLTGANIIVLDVETLHSADDCIQCGREKAHHIHGNHPFQPIGWNNHAALGLSLGCLWSYRTMAYYFFDQHTLFDTMRFLVRSQPLIVSHNGKRFDGPLMLAVLQAQPGHTWGTQAWTALWQRSYDTLDALWTAHSPDRPPRGTCTLDALSQANGYGSKQISGALAPRLWAEGRYAEVVNYNMGDVEKTRRLFEQIVETGRVLRGDGVEVLLPKPEVMI